MPRRTDPGKHSGVLPQARLLARLRHTVCIGAAALAPLLTEAIHSQVLELSGGSSSLYQAQGASLSVRSPNAVASIGAGFSGGRFVAGGSLQRLRGPYLLSLGMQQLPLDLPTDIEPGHRFRALGLGLEKGAPANGVAPPSGWLLFAGTTSAWTSTPLFQGIRPDTPAFAALYRHALSPSVQLASQTVYASRFTALESLSWRQSRTLLLAGAAGVSGGSPYGAVSADLHRTLLDARGSYMAARSNFQRAGLDTDLIAEPIRANLQVNLRSSQSPRYTAELGHHTFLNPAAAGSPAPTSTVDDVSLNAHFAALGLGSSLIHSTYNGTATTGLALTATVPLPSRWTMQVRYMESLLHASPNPTVNSAAGLERTTVATVTHEISSRLELSGVFTRSRDRNSLAASGSFTSSRVKLSADVQTLYIPTEPAHPFQQYLILSSELNLFGRLRLLASSFVSPNGKLLYTAEAHAVAAHALPAAKTVQPSFGQYLLQGRVLDADHVPICGAAILVDNEVLFTDSEGTFFLREKRRRVHHLRVVPEQFLDGYRYRIVSSSSFDLESQRPSSSSAATARAEFVVARDPQPASATEAATDSAYGSSSAQTGTAFGGGGL